MKFEQGFGKYKNDWTKISEYIKTRSPMQVRSHSQKAVKFNTSKPYIELHKDIDTYLHKCERNNDNESDKNIKKANYRKMPIGQKLLDYIKEVHPNIEDSDINLYEKFIIDIGIKLLIKEHKENYLSNSFQSENSSSPKPSESQSIGRQSPELVPLSNENESIGLNSNYMNYEIMLVRSYENSEIILQSPTNSFNDL